MMQSLLAMITAVQLALLPAPVAGCYTLSVGPWSRPGVVLRVPGFVMLHSDSTTPTAGMLSPDLTRPRPRAPIPGTPRWKRVGAAAVVLTWSDGFTGVTLPLRIQGDTLRGIATTFSDEQTAPSATATVTGVRVACDAGTQTK